MAKGPSRLDNVISLAKRRGFVFPCGDIYGGTRSAWDYGPLGVELKETSSAPGGTPWSAAAPTSWPGLLRHSPARSVGRLRSRQGLHRPLIECLNCHKRAREDQLIEELAEKKGVEESSLTTADLVCPNCGVRGQWTEPRAFSGLLKTYLARSTTRPACTTCAPRPPRASSSTTRTS